MKKINKFLSNEKPVTSEQSTTKTQKEVTLNKKSKPLHPIEYYAVYRLWRDI